MARSAGIPADYALFDNIGQRLGEVVADEAQVWEADLIVMGTHGRRGVSQTLLGSGAEQDVPNCPGTGAQHPRQ